MVLGVEVYDVVVQELFSQVGGLEFLVRVKLLEFLFFTFSEVSSDNLRHRIN